jgi:hypothetical protein
MTTQVEYTQTRTFKATVTAHKRHFLQKVCSGQRHLKDAFKGNYKTFFTVFLPKLSVGYPIPTIFLSIKNGNGAVLVRVKSPQELGNFFEEMATLCKSDNFLDNWERLQAITEKMITNEYSFLSPPDDLIETEIKI